MNRDLPLIPSLIFIASLVICIAIYMQRVGTFSVPVAAHFFEQSDEIKLLFGNQILNLKNDEASVSLQKFGVEQHVGQIGVSGNGDLFINTGGQSTSLAHKWSRFKRQTEKAPKESVSTLVRCIDGSTCDAWGDSKLQFDTAFSMFDVGNGNFIINDTARHQIHLVNSAGDVLDTLGGFFFPNHVFKYQNSFWVVNTNTNSFIELIINHTSLEKSKEQIYLGRFGAIQAKYRFPSVAYSTKNQNLIVLTHPNGMNRGRVFLLENSKARRLFEQLNDITAIYVDEVSVYASDYETHSLWSMNLESGRVQKLQIDSYDDAVATKKTVANKNWGEFIILASMISLVGLIALVISLMNSRPVKLDEINLDINVGQTVDTKQQLTWVERDSKHVSQLKMSKRLWKLSLVLVPIVLCCSFVLVFFGKGATKEMFYLFAKMSAFIILAMAIIWLAHRQIKKLHEKMLGWDGEKVHFKKHRAQTSVLPKEVYYSKFVIYTKGFTIPYQFLNRSFYDKQSFESLIVPALLKKNKLSPIKLFLLRLSDRNTDAFLELIAILLGISYIIFELLSF